MKKHMLGIVSLVLPGVLGGCIAVNGLDQGVGSVATVHFAKIDAVDGGDAQNYAAIIRVSGQGQVSGADYTTLEYRESPIIVDYSSTDDADNCLAKFLQALSEGRQFDIEGEIETQVQVAAPECRIVSSGIGAPSSVSDCTTSGSLFFTITKIISCRVGDVSAPRPVPPPAPEPCLRSCPSDFLALCGKSCSVEGDRCASMNGNGMVCMSGVWACLADVPPPSSSGSSCQPQPLDGFGSVGQ